MFIPDARFSSPAATPLSKSNEKAEGQVHVIRLIAVSAKIDSIALDDVAKQASHVY